MSAIVTINGKWLRRLRIERGISQCQLARQAQLNKNTIRRADYGKPITFKTAKKIADTLGIDVAELGIMTGDDTRYAIDNSMTEVSPFLRLCGEKLKQARKNRGMSIKDIVKKSGYTETTIKQAETGQRMSLYAVKDISETLGYDMLSFVLNKGEAFDDMSFRITKAEHSAYRAISKALSPPDMEISNTVALEMIVVLTRMIAQLGHDAAQGLGSRSAGPVLLDVFNMLAKQMMLDHVERTEKGDDVSSDVISHCVCLLMSVMKDIQSSPS